MQDRVKCKGPYRARWRCDAKWPKEKLLRHGPELPMQERSPYQQNIIAICASGCAVPTTAMIDSLNSAIKSLAGSVTLTCQSISITQNAL